MTRKNSPSRVLLVILVATAAFEVGSDQARAQWRGGWGGGFGGFNYVPQPTDFLNQQALVNASRDHGPVSNDVYANNPNSYINHLRDSGLEPHYDIDTRRSPGERAYSRYDSVPRQTVPTQRQPAPPVTAPKPSVPIASFFDASRKLVWPSDAPVGGDLIAKRDVSDRADLGVLQEVETRGGASITTVTNARKLLLDYGQPALQEIRTHSTPRIADTFHLFLLSLYESLAQAVAPSLASSAAPPPP
jgi:hypothetical protein